MSKTHKTSFKAYTAWNYQREIEELNKKSEAGWQLVKGGCFHSIFKYNPNIRYRYQLDFRKIEDLGRYIETFREQGWEYINSTFNGWHFFRKIADPNLPESAYEIFTDRQSLEEMNRRWTRFALFVTVAAGVLGIVDAVRWISEPQLPVLLQTITLLLISFFLLRGMLIMRNTDASRNRRGDSGLFVAFLLVLIIGYGSSVVLTAQRPHIAGQQKVAYEGELTSTNWLTVQIKYPDKYYFDLKFDSDKEMAVKLVDDEGTVIFTEVGTHLDKKEIPIKLKKGNYEVVLDFESDYIVEIDVD